MLQQMDLVTVVVPIYKVETYLKVCIDCILRQTYRNIEIILVDDGSPDNCPILCDEYAQKDERIIVIHKENGGLSDARNAGLKIAKGKFITFIDSDDYVGEHFIEDLYIALKENHADISICDYLTIEEDAVIEKRATKCLQFTNKEYLKALYHPIVHGMEFVAWGKLYKTELFIKNEISYPFGKVHEDTFTTYKLIYFANEIVFCNNVSYFYRQRPGSIMSSSFNLKYLVGIEATREAVEFFVNKKEYELGKLAFSAHVRNCVSLYCNVSKKYKEDNRCDVERKIRQELRKDAFEYRCVVSRKSKCILYAFCFFPQFVTNILEKWYKIV